MKPHSHSHPKCILRGVWGVYFGRRVLSPSLSNHAEVVSWGICAVVLGRCDFVCGPSSHSFDTWLKRSEKTSGLMHPNLTWINLSFDEEILKWWHKRNYLNLLCELWWALPSVATPSAKSARECPLLIFQHLPAGKLSLSWCGTHNPSSLVLCCIWHCLSGRGCETAFLMPRLVRQKLLEKTTWHMASIFLLWQDVKPASW